MPILRIPELMKFYVNDQTAVPLNGTTVAENITDLVTRYPSIKMHILDSKGNLRRYINLFINDTNINDLQGLQTALQETDKLVLLPSISGG